MLETESLLSCRVNSLTYAYVNQLVKSVTLFLLPFFYYNTAIFGE